MEGVYDKMSKLGAHTGGTIKPTRVSFSTSDRATKRVIAPYVRIVRHGQTKSIEKKEENKYFSFYVQNKPSMLMRNLSQFLSDDVDLPGLILETADVLKSVTGATGVVLYMVDSALCEIIQSGRNAVGPRQRASWHIQPGTTVAAFVAYQKEYVMVDDVFDDPRFPEGAGWKGPMVKSVLCVPVVTPDDDCCAVIELWRDATCEPFGRVDLKITIVVTGWMGAAIHQSQQRLALQKQQQLNDYLLNLTKCYFADTVLMEKMITEIVSFAKITLGAERGSFFIIDKDSDELVADLFDEGIQLKGRGSTLHKRKTKIRFAKDRGIAGLVARTGETVNVRDAYNDPRFNKEVDQKTGFITRSILCMPIMGIDGIMGVVQVVNKIDGPCFTNTDENLFKTFSVYCALALHYARLHADMKKTDKTNEIFRDMLVYHMKPCIHDIRQLMEKPHLELPENFLMFDWYISPELEESMPQLVLHMMNDIIGECFIELKPMSEFILSVKKSYRNNPYHNFEHAFNVCHCMYNILRRNSDFFTRTELKGLLIATLCHDLDHKGVTNNFLQLINDPIVQLYEDSPLEHHHFQVSVKIINDCRMFVSLSKTDYKELLREIEEAILATDLAMYFRSRGKLIKILSDDAFEWCNLTHRSLLKGIIMTCCDLSGQCKPYHIARKITDNVYKEFYAQGDSEKLMGFTPLSMMDREKQYMVPEDQVQFLTVVCIPCTEMMISILPNTIDLYSNCIGLRDTWKEIAALKGQRVWKHDESVVHKENEESKQNKYINL